MARTTVAVFAVVVGASLFTAGCSGGSSDGAASTTAASVTSTTAAPSSTTTAPATTSAPPPTTTTPPAKPCTGSTTAPPSGASTKQVIDVDGDGKPDTAWIQGTEDGTVTVGITTAAGGQSSVPFDSASPVERSAFVIAATEALPAQIILSDGRGASLYSWVGCAIKPVKNPQGATYAFDLGDRIGTGSGIGCANTSAGRRLVGLNRLDGSTDTTVKWSQTVIEIDGLAAHNGATTTGTYTSPADQAQIARLDDITCGNQTIEADGVHLQN